MDLNANFHGVPVKYWLVGASATGFMGFVLYRRQKAAKAAAAAASGSTTDNGTAGATGPLPGWSSLAGALGPLGGSSPTGPLTGYTSSGEPVYSTIKDTWRRRSNTDTPISIPPGEIGNPVTTVPTTPATTPIATPTISAPSVPSLPPIVAPPPPAVYQNSATVVPNPIPGDLSTVVQGITGGSPFTYGGSAAQASSLVSQLNQQPLVLPPASGVGTRYVLADGTSFVYG